jgi:hypothetical protein
LSLVSNDTGDSSAKQVWRYLEQQNEAEVRSQGFGTEYFGDGTGYANLKTGGEL